MKNFLDAQIIQNAHIHKNVKMNVKTFKIHAQGGNRNF